MMPSRHLREKENILFFPPADRLPFLRGSVWGKAKERCLGAGRPFPNTTLADMFIFWPVTREKMDSVLFLTLSASRRHRSLCLPCCFHVLHPLWRTSSPPRWVFPGHSGNRCRFILKEERFRSNTAPVFPPQNIVGNSLPSVTNSHKLTG